KVDAPASDDKLTKRRDSLIGHRRRSNPNRSGSTPNTALRTETDGPKDRNGSAACPTSAPANKHNPVPASPTEVSYIGTLSTVRLTPIPSIEGLIRFW